MIKLPSLEDLLLFQPIVRLENQISFIQDFIRITIHKREDGYLGEADFNGVKTIHTKYTDTVEEALTLLEDAINKEIKEGIVW